MRVKFSYTVLTNTYNEPNEGKCSESKWDECKNDDPELIVDVVLVDVEEENALREQEYQLRETKW